MDPMDFTMDEAQVSRQPPNTTPRHQCQTPQHSSTNAFASHARDSHHYDPVYDSTGWYQANSANATSRPPYTAPENLPPWGGNSFLPIPSWQGLADGQQPGGQSQDPSAFRQSRFMGMPWNEARGFDSLSFGYNPYTSPLNNNNPSSESVTGGTSSQASAGLASSSHMPPTYAQEAHLRSVQQAFQIYGQNRNNRFASSESTQRRPDDTAERSIRPNQPLSFMEQRTGKFDNEPKRD